MGKDKAVWLCKLVSERREGAPGALSWYGAKQASVVLTTSHDGASRSLLAFAIADSTPQYVPLTAPLGNCASLFDTKADSTKKEADLLCGYLRCYGAALAKTPRS